MKKTCLKVSWFEEKVVILWLIYVRKSSKLIYTMKNLGLILIIVGALLLILCALIPGMGDLADQNWYTWGSFFLIIAGLLTHIFMNKKVEEA